MATRSAAALFGLTALLTGAVALARDDAPQPSLSEKERACLAKLKPAEVMNDRVVRSHAIAMHGKAKYGPDFKHFDYVNPDAPVGGTLRLANEGSFDSFNPFIPKGDAANPGVFETLLASSSSGDDRDEEKDSARASSSPSASTRASKSSSRKVKAKQSPRSSREDGAGSREDATAAEPAGAGAA